MGGNRAGGLKSAQKIKAQNPNHFIELGKVGAAAYMAKPVGERRPRGFAAHPELAREAGRKGGKRRRGDKRETNDKR